MKQGKIIVNKVYRKGKIDKRIYGSFVEHMGRVVYSGVYEPENPCADEDGFRTDVLQAVKDAGITSIRYPGGNFVSCYHWEDGIGDKKLRPRRPELAWKAVETNEFGTDEFMKWCKKAGTEPVLAVNLGTRGIEDAVHYLEYCNFQEGTTYSDMRKDNGHAEPYHVKTWCLGNEMDGMWQLGHKDAKDYGKLARETAKAMKVLDPSVELVSCGSSLNTMDTYPEWEAATLEETYEFVDYISLHQYFDGHEKNMIEFLAQADEMNQYIKTVVSVCDYIKAKKRSEKELYISFDEWGVWTHHSEETVKECEGNPWKNAAPISEMIYSFQDSLLFAEMLMTLLKNADRVKIACQSLLANISAMIMTEKGGGLWLQPNYYPFAHMANYGKGEVMDVRINAPVYQKGTKQISFLDSVVVENAEEKELVVFAVNRSENQDMEVCVEIQGYKPVDIIEHKVMISEEPEATNRESHGKIKPQDRKDMEIKGSSVKGIFPKLSWNMVRIRTE
ncbi:MULTISPECIES: arabinosylfuranosidase ArfA [Blautia]|uniref:arabinosylfuranosidase ArfA n=1 Tax=Blautia TaxID=572511 RepID=UPI00258D5C15|nr:MULTISPECIES: alpha-N-arabinofuranosidase [Blautia]